MNSQISYLSSSAAQVFKDLSASITSLPASFPTLSLDDLLTSTSKLDVPYTPSLTIPSSLNLKWLTAQNSIYATVFILVVAVLSWMLDSHHEYDGGVGGLPLAILPKFHVTSVAVTAPALTTEGSLVEATTTLQRPTTVRHHRRKTLESIATLINLQDHSVDRDSNDIHSLSPQALDFGIEGSDLPDISFSSSIPPTTFPSPQISTTDGKNKKPKNRKNKKRRELERKKSTDVVERWEADLSTKIEKADIRRRKGSWRTSTLLAVRVPLGWMFG